MNLTCERSPVFSATHEIPTSAPTYTARPKQPSSAPAPSDGFAALIDSTAPASPDPSSVPQPVQPQRTDNAARDADRRDAPKMTNSDTAQATPAPKDAKDSSVSDNEGTDQPGKTAGASQSSAEGGGANKASSDGEKDSDQTKDGEIDTSTTASSAVAVDPNAVAVVVPVTADSASTPAGD